MSTPPPPPQFTPPTRRNAGERAALFCLVVPILVVVLNYAVAKQLAAAPRVVAGFLALEAALIVAALAAGVWALWSMRRRLIK